MGEVDMSARMQGSWRNLHKEVSRLAWPQYLSLYNLYLYITSNDMLFSKLWKGYFVNVYMLNAEQNPFKGSHFLHWWQMFVKPWETVMMVWSPRSLIVKIVLMTFWKKSICIPGLLTKLVCCYTTMYGASKAQPDAFAVFLCWECSAEPDPYGLYCRQKQDKATLHMSTITFMTYGEKSLGVIDYRWPDV